MKTLGWPPTYVARCPVTLFEAARGSTSWQTGGTVGELHMRPLGGAVLHFQLNDLLDGQVLFEHTMRKPDAISVPVDRFFVIRQENESFRGFGFRDKDAACEMRERIQKAVKPFTIGYAPPVITTIKSHEKEASDSDTSQTVGSFCKKSEVLKCESVPKRSSVRKKSLQREQPISKQSPVGTTMFTTSSTKSHVSKKWHRLVKGLRALSQLFAPDFSSAPLSDFGQPRDPSWIHDAVSAAKWTSQGLLGTLGLPPDPPPDFVNAPKVDSKAKKFKDSSFKSKSKSKASFEHQNT